MPKGDSTINICDPFMKIAYHLFTLLILLSLVTGCSLFRKDYPEIAHAITLRTAEQLKKEKGMELIGTGGGMIETQDYFPPIPIPSQQ